MTRPYTAASPLLISAIAGLPGSGKTALAEALAAYLGHTFVCRTWIGQAMFGTHALNPTQFQASAAASLLAAETNGLLRISSILADAEFLRPGAYEAVVAAAYRVDAHPHLIYLKCPTELAIDRTAHAVSQGEPLTPSRTALGIIETASQIRPMPASTIVIDATAPLDAQVEAITGALSTWYDYQGA